MRVISYNCQNFEDRNRRELVMCKLNADYVGIQGTRMEADRSAEVWKRRSAISTFTILDTKVPVSRGTP